jgi:hypothetical protein
MALALRKTQESSDPLAAGTTFRWRMPDHQRAQTRDEQERVYCQEYNHMQAVLRQGGDCCKLDAALEAEYAGIIAAAEAYEGSTRPRDIPASIAHLEHQLAMQTIRADAALWRTEGDRHVSSHWQTAFEEIVASREAIERLKTAYDLYQAAQFVYDRRLNLRRAHKDFADRSRRTRRTRW